RAQNLLIRFQTESAQKNATVELTLAVDPDVENVLVVVLELHPASAIRNDLAKKISLRRNALEKHTRRAMQLRNDHALGAVDDERSVVRHQRNLTEEYFLFLDVPDAFCAGGGVLGVDRQPDRYFQRRGVRHAPLLALHHVVLKLQTDRVAALVAERDHVLIEGPAMMAQHITGVERIRSNRRTAIPAGGPQMMQAFQIAALALPITNRVVDE